MDKKMGDAWFTIEKVSFLHAHLFSCGAPVRDVCLQPLADVFAILLAHV
jgi:hypothetical protein